MVRPLRGAIYSTADRADASERGDANALYTPSVRDRRDVAQRMCARRWGLRDPAVARSVVDDALGR
jgi:hypothetical protein